MKLRLLPLLLGCCTLAYLPAACGSGGSLMDSLRETESDEPAAATNVASATRTHSSGSNAVMTPFNWRSIDDAPWPEIFNDSNKFQYPFAEKFGIEPIMTEADAFLTSNKPIRRIASNNSYFVEELTHSYPYLVDNAADLLADIGDGFISRLKKQGVEGYRIRVTSALRSAYCVKKLRRVNINAVDSSTHKFGTTFDISYQNFYALPGATPTTPMTLQRALAATLFDLRRDERCMVKYERKSPCFHITTTK